MHVVLANYILGALLKCRHEHKLRPSRWSTIMTQRLYCLICERWLESDEVSLLLGERKKEVHSWFRCERCGKDHVHYADHIKVINAIKLKLA